MGLVSAAAAQAPAPAGEPVLLDLATAPATATDAIEAGRPLRIRAVNAVPQRALAGLYALTVRVENEPVAALSADAVQRPPAAGGGAMVPAAAGGGMCATLAAPYDALAAVDDERAVVAPTAALRVARAQAAKDIKDGKANPCPQADLDAADALLAATEVEWTVKPIRRGQRITVRLSTVRAGGQSRAWERTYSTGARGSWRTTYAFAFIGRAWNERRYFTRPTGTAGQFEIAPAAKRDWFDFAPAVFFSWMGTDAELQDRTYHWDAGVGFDLSAPVVFLGRNLTFNQNVSASLGVALHRQQVLLGRYRAGELVNTNLEEAQLLTSSYRPNPYIALAFRFGSNPFGGSRP